MNDVLILLALTASAIGISTVAGAVCGLFIRNLGHQYNDMILGSAGGIMLGSAVFGLIGPAAETPSPHALLLTVTGVFAGALLIGALDRITPHLHRLAGLDSEQHTHNKGVSRTLLFVSAIAIHKIPEGAAAGISFGTGELNSVITVAGGIVLQNIPEAMVVIAPLLAIGVTVRRTLMIATGIGAVSMAATAAGFALVSVMHGLLPFILAFAGGTMLYVVSDEMIPETHSHGYEKQSTFALLAGFMLILVLQHILG